MRSMSAFTLGLAALFYPTTLVAMADIDASKSVLTQHNDAQRTGWYPAETGLSPARVTPKTFGELARFQVQGMVTAQPLYVHGVVVSGASRNMLYVATNENAVYGFDVGSAGSTPPSAQPLLKTQFPGSSLLPGMRDGPQPCLQTRWKVGITSTPVIDPQTEVMYLVYRTGPTPGPLDPARPPGPNNYALGAQYWLAALDIRTLNAVQPTQQIIGPPDFGADMQLNRPALLLWRDHLYVAFGGAVCDYGGNPYVSPANKPNGHGWVFVYDAASISTSPLIVNTTPKTSLGGIWQSGNGLSAFGESAYAFTGNNGMPDSSDAPELAESLLRLTLPRTSGQSAIDVQRLLVGNWYRLDTGNFSRGSPPSPGDSDLGAGGPVVLANNRIAGGGKQGRVYIVDPATLQQTQPAFQAFFNSWHPEINVCNYDEQQKYGPNMHGSLVSWHPGEAPYSLFYGIPEKEYLKGFRAYDDGHIDTVPTVTTIDSGIRSPDNMPGGFLSISSDGGKNGIVWALVPRIYGRQKDATYDTVPGRLLAFDALTLRELWSDDASGGDNFVKFAVPTIADGRVFRASYDGDVQPDGTTNGTIVVYGTRTAAATIPQLQIPTMRPLTATWDPSGNQLVGNQLDLFTSAANGSAIGSIFLSYSTVRANEGCVDSWQSWYPVTDIAPNSSGFAPVTALWRPQHDHLDVFIAGDDGTVLSTYREANLWQPLQSNAKAETNWFSIHPESGRTAPHAPVTAVWRDPNTLDLFITGNDKRIKTIRFSNNAWDSSWHDIAPASGHGVPGQTITAVWRPAQDHIDLFMTGDDGTVKSIYAEHDVWQPAWFTLRSDSMHAKPPQPITAVWRDSNHLDLFAVDQSGVVRSIYFENNAWQPAWFPLFADSGKTVAGQAITALWRPGTQHLDLFMVGANNAVQSLFFENSEWHGPWFSLHAESLGATPGQPVTALWRSSAHLDLFASDANGHVKSIYFENNAWQPAWFTLL